MEKEVVLHAVSLGKRGEGKGEESPEDRDARKRAISNGEEAGGGGEDRIFDLLDVSLKKKKKKRESRN